MKLPKLAVWDHSAEKRPRNYQVRQFENMPLIMDWANAEKRPWNCQGWQFEDQKSKSAEKRSSNCQVWQFEKVAVKLPRSAVWVHEKKCGSNSQGRQFYGQFLNFQIWQVDPSDVANPRFQRSAKIVSDCNEQGPIQRARNLAKRHPAAHKICGIEKPAIYVYLGWHCHLSCNHKVGILMHYCIPIHTFNFRVNNRLS